MHPFISPPVGHGAGIRCAPSAPDRGREARLMHPGPAMQLLPYPVRRFEAPSFLDCFRRIPQGPTGLQVQGAPEALGLLEDLPERALAIVGTRRPQHRSLELVQRSVEALRGSKLIILSGLAVGIDAAAHRAALRAGLRTIAVLGSPLDNMYPRENLELARQILDEGGLIVTEYASGTPIRPHHFIRRNRIIATCARAIWIVEAGRRSGALNTAAWAGKHGGDCYATPCFPGDPAFEGNQSLLANGVTAFWSPFDLGHTWSELASLKSAFSLPLFAKHPGERELCARASGFPPGGQYDAERLTQEVSAHTASRGGIPVEQLLDWAFGLSWEPQRFFSALQRALIQRNILDQDGVLNAPQTRNT